MKLPIWSVPGKAQAIHRTFGEKSEKENEG